MAALEHAPLASHPTVMLLRVPMKDPYPNGLRSDAEFDAMSRVEDVLVSALGSNTSAIYWGRQVHRGATDFMFQLEGEPGPGLFERLRPFLSVPDYTVEPKFRSDPEWELYTQHYPSAFHEHTMTNRALQEQLREMGDRLKRRRVIDHVALFPAAASADTAARTLRPRRFTIDEVDGPDESGHLDVCSSTGRMDATAAGRTPSPPRFSMPSSRAAACTTDGVARSGPDPDCSDQNCGDRGAQTTYATGPACPSVDRLPGVAAFPACELREIQARRVPGRSSDRAVAG